jgi:ATP-dependent DNA helicase RecG
MSQEGQELDHKSLRYALGKHKEADGLACDCVGFANATGGVILLGIEDGHDQPPSNQRVPDDLIDQLRKRISQITINVSVVPILRTDPNGGEYIEIRIHPNLQGIASTSDGRYFQRVADETHRLLPDDLARLIADRGSFVWEMQTTRRIPVQQYDPQKLAAFSERIRTSDRVSDFVKGKSDGELLEYYLFAKNGFLTNLGILWIGWRDDRAGLLYAPAIQCIKYDERGHKVRKQVWDDYSLNPMEMLSAVWAEVPDWRESYELPSGLFRKSIPHYEDVVVRELLANALVHRPYTQRGDIFINLYPDRMEIHNPGLLPAGVTPRNILHASIQRNQHLAKVFCDLKLMEKEGSGYERIYEVLLASGRPVPEVQEGNDRVTVTVQKQIVKPEVIDFMMKVDETFQPSQRELIALGLLAQQESLTATQMIRILSLPGVNELRHWIGRLKDWGLIAAHGRTRGTEYFVDPKVLRKLEFKGRTSLKGIDPHRLRELVLRDLEIYRESKIGDIHKRVGMEIVRRRLQRILHELVADGTINQRGSRKSTTYVFVPNSPLLGTNGT